MKLVPIFLSLLSLTAFSKEVICECDTIEYSEIAECPQNEISETPYWLEGKTDVVEIKTSKSCAEIKQVHNKRADLQYSCYLVNLEADEGASYSISSDGEIWENIGPKVLYNPCTEPVKYLTCRTIDPQAKAREEIRKNYKKAVGNHREGRMY